MLKREPTPPILTPQDRASRIRLYNKMAGIAPMIPLGPHSLNRSKCAQIWPLGLAKGANNQLRKESFHSAAVIDQPAGLAV